MNFNFYDQYKNYSNTDLLKIAKQPDNYQAAAVEAATQILNERQVSETEFQQVDKYFQDIDAKEQLKKDKINFYKEKTVDFLEPVLKPTTEVKPHKWINILLLVIALQYLWTLFINGKHLIDFIGFVIDCKQQGFDLSNRPITYWRCASSLFDITIFFEFISLIYVPVIFYLLYKKRRWGWILLFADNLFVFISSLSQSYIFFKYQQIHQGDTFSFIIQLLIRGAFGFFLWRDVIANYFGVTAEIKRKTAVITVAVSLLFIIGIQLMV
jgi:hypothetical protein